MTDKELLELAAKAAGISVKWDNKWNCFMRDARPVHDEFDSEWLPWRPLTDDGDALRLAVKLSMKLYVGEAYPWNEALLDYPQKLGVCVDEDEEPDPYAATRRAIVRAAAEIGKTL